jgi:hypothetical protein
VALGVDPIEVEWRREGDELFGRVSPQAGKGPWVVRLEVSDQFGIPLGRDFVEVTQQAPANLVPRQLDDKTTVRVASVPSNAQ